MRRLVILLLCLCCLPLLAKDRNKEEEEERRKRDQRDFERIEKVFTPKTVSLIRFPNYICDDGHYTGEFSGTCQQVLESPEGGVKVCRKPLRLASRKLRSFWSGNRLVVRGQVSEKLPSGLVVMLTLRYFRPGGDPIAWKEITVRGKAKRGWRNFEAVFTFPKRRTIEITTERGKIRQMRVRVEILNGEYWVEARFVKSKQPRDVQRKLSELQSSIPDYKCLDCRKTFREPSFVRCPVCGRKLTRKVRRYPRVVRDKEGNRKIVGKLRDVFHCRRCNQDVEIPRYDKCPACGSPNIVPMKKDRAIYEEGYALVYVPKPTYDPSNPDEVKDFQSRDREVFRRVQEHYSQILKKLLKLNKELDKNFAAAYRLSFMENGKLDQENWEKWVFSSVFTNVKRKGRKGQRLIRRLLSINRFGRHRFDREAWKAYIREEFAPAIRELMIEHYKYKESLLALRYPKSYIYLNRLLFAVLKKGISHYTPQLYSAFQIQPDPEELDVPTTGIAVDVVSVSRRFLNKLFMKIDEELQIREYWKKRR